MCLIALNSKRHLSQEEFTKAWNTNGDGVGFAWFEENTIRFKKGFMSKDEAYAFSETLTLPFCVHFRKASIGETSPLLTHPFIVSPDSPLMLEGDAPKLLMHNGTVSFWKEYMNAAGHYDGAKGNISTPHIISDTRAIAMVIANENQKFLHNLGTSKFIFMNLDDRKFRYYGDFVEWDGLLLSNTYWKTKTKETIKIEVPKNYKPSQNHTTIPVTDYKKPWKSNQDPLNIVLKYLLDKMTENAANKLWRKYLKKKDIGWAHTHALKVLKQQNTGLNFDRIERFTKRFIEASQKPFPDNVNHLTPPKPAIGFNQAVIVTETVATDFKGNLDAMIEKTQSNLDELDETESSCQCS